MTTHEFLTWTEVNQTHNTIRAIYHMGKLVHSMLITDNGKNIMTDTKIIFMLPKSIQLDYHINQVFRPADIPDEYREWYVSYTAVPYVGPYS